MIIIEDHTDVNLNELAEAHYQNLVGTPLLDGVNYHATRSLISKIRTQRDRDIHNQIRLNFWDYLLNNDFRNLKRVIKSRPNELKLIIVEIEEICGDDFFSNDQDYNTASLTAFGRIVKNIFNYELYRSGKACKEFCNQLKLNLCPYCNLLPIQVIMQIIRLSGEQRRMALLQLDHFYSQSRHPYFSLSFFNLIPGCSPCNAQLKHEKKFDIETHFNPFEKRFDDYFQFQIVNLIINNYEEVEIDVENKLPYPDNSLNDFEIISRYNSILNKRVVFSMYKSFKNHSPKIRRSIANQFINLFSQSASDNIGLLEKHNIPVHVKEINEVQAGKLRRDFAKQMQIL